MTYKITGVTYVKDIDYKGKTLNKYRVKVEGVSDALDFVQAAEKGEPQVGESIDGEIQRNEYGASLKRTYKPSFTPRTQTPQRSEFTMFASYAKDILIAYANFMDWDSTKVNEATFNKLVRMAGSGATLLRDAENDKAVTEAEVKSSW